MSIGWKESQHSSNKKVKVDVSEDVSELDFWDEMYIPNSPITSEISIDTEKQPTSITFKVISILKKETFDRIGGEKGESVDISGVWRECLPRIGSTITILQCLCCRGRIIDLKAVTNEKNYIIIHSKKSQTSTRIIQSTECVRKALLSEKIEIYNRKVSKQQVHGLIIHEWFEYLLQKRDANIKEVAYELKRILYKHILQMYRIDEKIENTFREIVKYVGALRKFISTLEYTHHIKNTTRYSSILQIKGKSDGVIENAGKETEIELKTGEQLHIDNIAQVILYGLIQKEQTGECSQILYHMKSGHHQKILLKHKELIRILCDKNKIVQTQAFTPRKIIPHCRICYQRDTCSSISEIEEAHEKNLFSMQINTQENIDMQMVNSEKTDNNKEKNCNSFLDGISALKQLLLDDKRLFGYLWSQIQEEESNVKESSYLFSIIQWENTSLRIEIEDKDILPFFPDDFVVVYDSAMCEVGKGTVFSANKSILEVHMFEQILFKHKGYVYLSKDPCLKYFAELRGSLLLLYTTEKIKKTWLDIPKKSELNIPISFVKEFYSLNIDQQQALFNSLSPQPYSLIHGMPGTGKTKVISLLIRILVSMGKRVLVCCYTKLSLHNIQKRLEPYAEIKMYRTGVTKVETVIENPEDVENVLSSYNVVLSTTRALFRDIIFEKSRRFDMYIADEATQQNFLLSVIPTMISDTFVLVGDYLQLHPLANVPGLKISLFDLLRERCSVSTLSIQYRMPKCIMDVPNAMFYSNRMKCKRAEIGSICFVDAGTEEAERIVRRISPCVQILCYFNEQVKAIRGLNKKAETIDRFQGSEADDILLILDSFTDVDSLNSIFTSVQRLNVALTRARRSLVVLGSKKKLSAIPLFVEFFRHIPIVKEEEIPSGFNMS